MTEQERIRKRREEEEEENRRRRNDASTDLISTVIDSIGSGACDTGFDIGGCIGD